MSNFQVGNNIIITNVNASYWNNGSWTLDDVRRWIFGTPGVTGKIIIPQGEWNETVFNSFKNANANYQIGYIYQPSTFTSANIVTEDWSSSMEEGPYLTILILNSADVSNMNSTFSEYTWYNDPEVWSDLPDTTNKLFRFPRATNARLESKTAGNEGLLALNRDTNQLSFIDTTWASVNGIIDPSTSSTFSSLVTQVTDSESFGLVELTTSGGAVSDLTAGSNVTWIGTGSATGNNYNAVYYPGTTSSGNAMPYGHQQPYMPGFGTHNGAIEHAWSNSVYNNRTYAPITAVLQKRSEPTTYQYSNNWESAWWLQDGSQDSGEILIIKLMDGVSCTMVTCRNSVQVSNYNAGGIITVWKNLVFGEDNSIISADFAGTHALLGGSDFGTTYFTDEPQQYLMFTRSGATGWSRLERILLL